MTLGRIVFIAVVQKNIILISTFVINAVQTRLSSFTAPRGPLSPLGNVKG